MGWEAVCFQEGEEAGERQWDCAGRERGLSGGHDAHDAGWGWAYPRLAVLGGPGPPLQELPGLGQTREGPALRVLREGSQGHACMGSRVSLGTVQAPREHGDISPSSAGRDRGGENPKPCTLAPTPSTTSDPSRPSTLTENEQQEMPLY